jgi:hypothetical protein
MMFLRTYLQACQEGRGQSAPRWQMAGQRQGHSSSSSQQQWEALVWAVH